MNWFFWLWSVGFVLYWMITFIIPEYRRDMHNSSNAQFTVSVFVSLIPFLNLLAFAFSVAALFDLGIVDDWLDRPAFKKD